MNLNRVTDPGTNERPIFQIGLVGLNSTSDIAVEDPRFQVSGVASDSKDGDVSIMNTIDEINAISSMASDSERRARPAPPGTRSPGKTLKSVHISLEALENPSKKLPLKINSESNDSGFTKLTTMPQNAEIEMISEKDIQTTKNSRSNETEAFSREPQRSNSFPNFQKSNPNCARDARFKFLSKFSESYNQGLVQQGLIQQPSSRDTSESISSKAADYRLQSPPKIYSAIIEESYWSQSSLRLSSQERNFG